jgi:hypothetical protein
MGKLVPVLSLCICLVATLAACGESAPTGGASATSTSAASTSTVKVATPDVTVLLNVGGKVVSVASGTPVAVAPGKYEVLGVTCNKVVEKGGKKESWQVMASSSLAKLDPVKVTEGAVTSLEYGTPLVAKVEAGKVVGAAATRTLPLELVVTGRAGEVYNSFKKNGVLPPEPGFKIVDEKGKQIAQVNFEFG